MVVAHMEIVISGELILIGLDCQMQLPLEQAMTLKVLIQLLTLGSGCLYFSSLEIPVLPSGKMT